MKTAAQLQKEKQSRTTWSFERKDGPAWEDSSSWKTKAERDNAGAGTTTVTISANENKNASSAETLYGNYRLSTRDQYATSAKTMFTSAGCSGQMGYQKAKPADGFDRLSANRTNYELGTAGTTYQSTASRSHGNPRETPAARQPVFAKPRQDLGHGSKFNIITGSTRDGVYARGEPGRVCSYDRLVRNRGESDSSAPREAAHKSYDLISGQVRANAVAPPPVRSRKDPGKLGSLGALRPHSPSQ